MNVYFWCRMANKRQYMPKNIHTHTHTPTLMFIYRSYQRHLKTSLKQKCFAVTSFKQNYKMHFEIRFGKYGIFSFCFEICYSFHGIMWVWFLFPFLKIVYDACLNLHTFALNCRYNVWHCISTLMVSVTYTHTCTCVLLLRLLFHFWSFMLYI